MKPEEQRIELAKLDGWKLIRATPEAKTDGSQNWIEDYCGTKNGVRTCIPDYLSDLNAVHELEKLLTPTEWPAYVTLLCGITRDRNGEGIVFATAAQRCEAILKVKGLWK